MKKLMAGLMVSAVLSLGVAAGASAVTSPQTDITGVVTENHMAVANADVKVECNAHVRTDTTDAHGSYLVTFPAGDCAFGSTVKVTAMKDGKSGAASGTVMGITTKLNLSIVNVAIPEYGLMGAILAGGAGLGMVAYMRRRQQVQAQL